MTDGEKIHKMLEYLCSLPKNVSSVDTLEISNATGFSLSETNILARQIVDNNDARNCSTMDNKDTICLLRILATRDAFESGKYLKQNKSDNIGMNLIGKNIFFGDINQSSLDFEKNIEINSPQATPNNKIMKKIGVVSLILMIITIIVMIILDIF